MVIRRHTPLVLLAMLVAAAFASLLLLPASGQTFDKTEGKTGSGGFSVGVFSDISDAQLAKNVFNSTYNTYVPTTQTPVALGSGITNPGEHTTDDTAYLANPEVQPQYTFFDGTLYVSNNPAAHNTVLITAVDSKVTASTDGCVEATVRSGRDTITVQMARASYDTNTYYQAFVRVLDPRAELPQGTPDYESSDGPACVDTPDPATDDIVDYTDGVTQSQIASILGRHGDTITISIAGAGQVSLEVDGEGPDLDEITPEHDSAWRSGRLDFSFEVRDDDSGLRHDGELVRSADGDDTQVNGDRDQVTSGEPLTLRSPGQISVNGKAADIGLRVGSMSDITDIGRWTLLGSRPGVAYEFSARGNNFDEGRYEMEVTAKDRAGNETMSVGWYDDDDMPQPYTFTIDDTEPSVRAVQAGVGYDTREEKEVPDRKSIMVDFGEALRSGIDHEQFTVSGHRVVGIVHPGRLSGDDMALDIEGNSIDDPRSRIYLQLADELASDETPDVLLFGGIVYDLAGNPNDSVDRTAEDAVAPLFRVGVAALAEGATLTPGPLPAREEGKGRLVANSDGEFVVDVRSDEEVRRRPTVYFVGIDTVEGTRDNGTKTGEYIYSIRSVQTGGALVEQEDPLHWRRAYEASRLTGLGELIGVIVSAEDENRNVFSTPGWKPESRQDNPSDGDVLDVEAMDEAGLLLELDSDFNDDATPELRVTPRRGQEDDETESARPIVAMLFSAEGEEYALCPTGTNGGCGGDNPDAEFSDSHAKVYITEITLNGSDASSRLSRVDDAQFALQAGNLAQGRHEVVYKAVDEAGNEAEGEFAFSVVARGAYEIDISPGWNLISVPGTPVDPSLNAVIPPSGGISAVMSYQGSNWLTAAVDEDGSWRGSLTEIEAGYGYWVYATSFATVAPLIPEQETTSLPPTIRVNHGWNLLGVIDLFQNAAGKAPGAGDGDGEADNYFGSFDWRVAYTFDGQYHRWVRIAPEDDKDDEEADDDEPPEIVNGRGYWVWSAEPGTLVP